MAYDIIRKVIHHGNQRDKHQKHRCDIRHQFDTGNCTRRNSTQHITVTFVAPFRFRILLDRLGLRTHNLRNHNRTRHCHDGSRQQMGSKHLLSHRILSAQHAYITAHYRTSDRSHTGNHNEKQLRTVHRRQIILDQNR